MKSAKPNNAILLVSDITKGMKSIGSKSLLPINKNLTVIEHQIQYLKKFYNPINIYVCVGFEHEKIIKITNKYNNVYCINHDAYETDNQVGGLVHCLKNIDMSNAFVINNGVLLLDKLPIDLKFPNIFITSKSPKTHFEVGSSSSTDTKYLFYDLPNKWLECIFLNSESIYKILEISQKTHYRKLFLFEMINLLIEHEIKIRTTNIKNNLPIKINNIKDLSTAKRNYEKHLHNKVKK
jgi:hypothetical protein